MSYLTLCIRVQRYDALACEHTEWKKGYVSSSETVGEDRRLLALTKGLVCI